METQISEFTFDTSHLDSIIKLGSTYYPLTPTVKAYAQVRYYDSTKDIDSLSGSIGISGQF